MKFNRQHILLVILGLIAVVRIGDYAVNAWIAGPLKEKKAQTEELKEEIGKYRKALSEARVAGKQISGWQKQSLPADLEVARSSYRNWLLDLVGEVGVLSPTVDSSTPANRRGLYTSLPFSVRGRASLQQLTRLLFEFTNTGHLHRIQSLNLTPVSSGTFDVNLSIEALIVPGTKRKAGLGTAKSDRLASPMLTDYSAIYRDNVFGIGYIDPLSGSQLTAITFSNGRPQAWITRENEKTQRIEIGGRVQLGDVSATVVDLTEEEMVLEIAGRKLKYQLGKDLSTGIPVEPQSS